MMNLQLQDEKFLKEIQVVMEERRMRTEDRPTALLYYRLDDRPGGNGDY